MQLLQENKIPLQMAYKYVHKDVAEYLVKKTVDIPVDPIQISKVPFN